MEEVKVCRICLNVNVKMYKLEGNLLENYYQHVLAGLDRKHVLELSQYACYECVYYIQKYCSFREKCFRGYSLLLLIYKDNGMVTENVLKTIDRSKLGLCSSLVHFVPIVEHVYVDPIDETTTNDISDICDISMFLKFHDVKSENDVKVEDDESDLDFSEEEYHTEQPTSERNVQEIIKSQKAKENCQKSNDSLDICTKKPWTKDKDATDLEMKQPKRRPAPKCQKRPKSARIINEDSRMDDVTVVKISVEEQLEQVTKRQHSSNYIRSEYKCVLCYKGFIDPDAFDNHMKKHDPVSSGSFKCSICKFCFPSMTYLKKHRAHHVKNYICNTCSYVCKTATQAKQHQNKHKGKFYNCKHCSNTTTFLSSHLSHMRLKHPSEFICELCGYAFVSKIGLTQHRTLMHKNVTESQSSNTVEEMRYCRACDVHHNSLQMWKRHIASATHLSNESPDLTCKTFGRTSRGSGQAKSSRRVYPRPGRNVHPSFPRAWPAKCLHCDAELATAHKYAGHFRKAHRDQPYPATKDYVCDICGKGYTSNTFLRYHRRTHFEERTYKCKQCPKAFFNQFNLMNHMRAHSDDRPHACTLCSKAFKIKSALIRHMQSHTGEKPYVCDLCDKAFTQSSSRKLHVKTVHLKEPAPPRKRTRLKKPRPAQAESPSEPTEGASNFTN